MGIQRLAAEIHRVPESSGTEDAQSREYCVLAMRQSAMDRSESACIPDI